MRALLRYPLRVWPSTNIRVTLYQVAKIHNLSRLSRDHLSKLISLTADLYSFSAFLSSDDTAVIVATLPSCGYIQHHGPTEYIHLRRSPTCRGI